MESQSIVITGASGLLGQRLVERMHKSGNRIYALGRGDCPAPIARFCNWRRYDLAQCGSWTEDADALVHAAPLWLLPDILTIFKSRGGLTRFIAFSSTSALTKIRSREGVDRNLAEKLVQAENQVREIAGDSIDCTLIRPTLVYGYGRDKNISRIAGFIFRFGFFPVAGPATGLRQPVHVDDLVDAVAAILGKKSTCGKTYNLAGAEVLAYDEMVRRIFRAMGRRPKLIHLPVGFYRQMIRIRGRGDPAGAASRMNEDFEFDISPARAGFGYAPQAFLEYPRRDLPGLCT